MASWVWTSNQSGNWSNAALWSLKSVPGKADDVEIDATGAAFTVTVSAGVVVENLTVGDDATLALGGVELTASTYVNGKGSTLSGFGTVAAVYSGAGAIVANGGVLDFTMANDVLGGAISGAGTLEIAANAALDATSISVANFEIEGFAVTLTADEALKISSSFRLGAGATFSIGVDVTVSGADTFDGDVSGVGALTVAGGVAAFQAGATLGVDELLQIGGVSNFDETLGFTGALVQTAGTIEIGQGDILTLGGHADTFDGTLTGLGALDISGTGQVVFGAATLTIGKIVISGDEALSFDDDVTFAGSFDEEAGSLLISDTLKLSGVDTLSGAVSGGALDITGGVTTVTASGSLSLQNVNVSAGATLAIEASDDDIFKVVSNSGVILVQGAVGQPGVTSFDDVLTQSAKGVVELRDDAAIIFNANAKGGLVQFGPGHDELLEVDDSTIAVGAQNTLTFGAKIKDFGFGDAIGIVGAKVTKVSQRQVGDDTWIRVSTSDDAILLKLVGNYSDLHFSFKESSTLDEDLITASPLVMTPIFSGAGVIAKYHETGPAVTVDAKLRLAPAIADVKRARVAISAGFESGDALQWVGEGGVIGTYDAVKGVLIFTGKASAATYAAIFDSITFSSTSTAMKNRTLSFTATSGGFTSAPATTTVKVLSALPAAPLTASTASVGEGQLAVASRHALESAAYSHGEMKAVFSTFPGFDFAAASSLIAGTGSAHEAGLEHWTPVLEGLQGFRLADPPSG